MASTKKPGTRVFWVFLAIYHLFFLWPILHSIFIDDYDDNAVILVFLSFLLFPSFVCLYVLIIRWIASTAESSGRSYVGFMILAILQPLVMAIIVLMFKKDSPSVSDSKKSN